MKDIAIVIISWVSLMMGVVGVLGRNKEYMERKG